MSESFRMISPRIDTFSDFGQLARHALHARAFGVMRSPT